MRSLIICCVAAAAQLAATMPAQAEPATSGQAQQQAQQKRSRGMSEPQQNALVQQMLRHPGIDDPRVEGMMQDPQVQRLMQNPQLQRQLQQNQQLRQMYQLQHRPLPGVSTDDDD